MQQPRASKSIRDGTSCMGNNGQSMCRSAHLSSPLGLRSNGLNVQCSAFMVRSKSMNHRSKSNFPERALAFEEIPSPVAAWLMDGAFVTREELLLPNLYLVLMLPVLWCLCCTVLQYDIVLNAARYPLYSSYTCFADIFECTAQALPNLLVTSG